MLNFTRSLAIFLLTALCLSPVTVASSEPLLLKATKRGGYGLVHKDFRIGLRPRTHQQIAAFYEARGLPKTAIKELEKVCFFTLGMHNTSKDVLWLDLNNWQFFSNGEPVKRLDKAYWKATLQQMGVSRPLQATFRWTQMPTTLDFRDDEREGGNIILPRDKSPYTVTATLIAQADKSGKQYHLRVDNMACADEN